MKRFLLILTALLLTFCVPFPAQLVRFLNFSDTTKIVNGDIYTVRYELDGTLAKDALYLIFTMTAPGSRYQVPAWQCYAPPFPNCAKEFPVYISANDGQRLQLIASSQLSQTRGILDRSGLITVVPRTTAVRLADTLLLTVYPNPASDYVTARFEQDAGATVVLYILNTKGEEVYRYTSRTAGQQWVGFDLNALPSGGYFLRAETPQGVSTTKFAIKH